MKEVKHAIRGVPQAISSIGRLVWSCDRNHGLGSLDSGDRGGIRLQLHFARRLPLSLRLIDIFRSA